MKVKVHLFHTDERPADQTPVQTLCGVTVAFEPTAITYDNPLCCERCLELRYDGANGHRKMAFALPERHE